MPNGTGHILVVVDAFSRYVSLRKCNDATGKEVAEEMLEAAYTFGTFPVILRTDNGPCFIATEFQTFCKAHQVEWVPGIPDHHQGQGLAETRMRTLAEALIATLGHKAPSDWNYQKTLPKLEHIFNSTFCDGVRGSPYWVLHGREPRTFLSASLDWDAPAAAVELLGHPEMDANTINNLIGVHHSTLNAAEGRASMATCLAQAQTKFQYDGSHTHPTFAVGSAVIVQFVAPNKMLPHFRGPYVVTGVSKDKNFISVKGLIDEEVRLGPYHVSRVIPFDASRATAAEAAEFLAPEGLFIVADVKEHRVNPDGSRSYHVSWRCTPLTTWLPEQELGSNKIVQEYRERNGLSPEVANPARMRRTRGHGRR